MLYLTTSCVHGYLGMYDIAKALLLITLILMCRGDDGKFDMAALNKRIQKVKVSKIFVILSALTSVYVLPVELPL